MPWSKYRILFTYDLTFAESMCSVDTTLRFYARTFRYEERRECVFNVYRFVETLFPTEKDVKPLDAFQVYLPGAKQKAKRVAEEPADVRPVPGNVKRQKHLRC